MESEKFIYHRVVPNMTGTVLYPLNQLKDRYPDIYAEHVKKYVGREHLLEAKIPTLNCLWNDALHFTAVAPQELYTNLEKAGINAEEITWKQWYKIPTSMLDKENTTVCIYRRDVAVIPDARDFSPFDSTKMAEYRSVPEETIEYYRQQNAARKRPLLFHKVPHILYKGIIDISSCEIIKL